jgi:hypothetical protein
MGWTEAAKACQRLVKPSSTTLPLPVNVPDSPMSGAQGRTIPRCLAVAGRLDG